MSTRKTPSPEARELAKGTVATLPQHSHSSAVPCCDILTPTEVRAQRTLLWTVLVINGLMFTVEFLAGFLAGSSALFADSLDMLGDALVYGLSLYVVAKPPVSRARASRVKGCVMLLLGLAVLGEALSKGLNGSVPKGEMISGVGICALIANGVCFFLLTRKKHGDINMRAAWICSRNDVIANASVIVAGLFVYRWHVLWPDILAGAGISVLVIQSAVRVLRDSVKDPRSPSDDCSGCV